MIVFRVCPICEAKVLIDDPVGGGLAYSRCTYANCPINFEQWVQREFTPNVTAHLRPQPKQYAMAYSVEINNKYKIVVHENDFRIWKVKEQQIDTNLILQVRNEFDTDLFFTPDVLEQKIKMWITFS